MKGSSESFYDRNGLYTISIKHIKLVPKYFRDRLVILVWTSENSGTGPKAVGMIFYVHSGSITTQ